MLLHCAIVMALLWLEPCVQGQTRSPCPDVFQYSSNRNGEVGTIQAQPPGPTNHLDVEANVTIYGIALKKGRDEDSGIKLTNKDSNKSNKILNGESVEYKLSMRPGLPVPVINNIIVNGVTLCQGPSVVPGTTHTILWSKSSFRTTGKPNTQALNPRPTPKPKPHVIQRPPPARMPTGSCGQTLGINSLVFNGEPTKRGQAPWVVAMFRNAEISIDSYFCTGTLINRMHFVTAAHCIKLPGERALDEENIIVILGKFNLTRVAEGGQQSMEVDKIFIHPDFEKKHDYDADLAVVKLASPASYNQYVQPICLRTWSSDIIGKTGLLVSWGINEEGEVNQGLKSVEMPIVDIEECRNSNKALETYVVGRMFCAGARDNSGPCVGDSGGGLVISRKDKWYLRGVVSIGVKSKTKRCNLNHYVAFTDIAQFSDWLARFQDNA